MNKEKKKYKNNAVGVIVDMRYQISKFDQSKKVFVATLQDAYGKNHKIWGNRAKDALDTLSGVLDRKVGVGDAVALTNYDDMYIPHEEKGKIKVNNYDAFLIPKERLQTFTDLETGRYRTLDNRSIALLKGSGLPYDEIIAARVKPRETSKSVELAAEISEVVDEKNAELAVSQGQVDDWAATASNSGDFSLEDYERSLPPVNEYQEPAYSAGWDEYGYVDTNNNMERDYGQLDTVPDPRFDSMPPTHQEPPHDVYNSNNFEGPQKTNIEVFYEICRDTLLVRPMAQKLDSSGQAKSEEIPAVIEKLYRHADVLFHENHEAARATIQTIPSSVNSLMTEPKSSERAKEVMGSLHELYQGLKDDRHFIDSNPSDDAAATRQNFINLIKTLDNQFPEWIPQAGFTRAPDNWEHRTDPPSTPSTDEEKPYKKGFKKRQFPNHAPASMKDVEDKMPDEKVAALRDGVLPKNTQGGQTPQHSQYPQDRSFGGSGGSGGYPSTNYAQIGLRLGDAIGGIVVALGYTAVGAGRRIYNDAAKPLGRTLADKVSGFVFGDDSNTPKLQGLTPSYNAMKAAGPYANGFAVGDWQENRQTKWSASYQASNLPVVSLPVNGGEPILMLDTSKANQDVKFIAELPPTPSKNKRDNRAELDKGSSVLFQRISEDLSKMSSSSADKSKNPSVNLYATAMAKDNVKKSFLPEDKKEPLMDKLSDSYKRFFDVLKNVVSRVLGRPSASPSSGPSGPSM